MRVLIACESSGIVREAFRARGHDAFSNDLLTAADGSLYHYQMDARELLALGWDLLIAHPSCTFLCASGMHWTTRGLRDPKLTTDAAEFVRALWTAKIPRVCIENPVGSINRLIPEMPRPQYVQPYQFGDDASKKTGLWLRGLPPLIPTQMVAPRIVNGRPRWANQTDSGQNRLGPSADRWRKRAQTYPGIAAAMAEQWGGNTP